MVVWLLRDRVPFCVGFIGLHCGRLSCLGCGCDDSARDIGVINVCLAILDRRRAAASGKTSMGIPERKPFGLQRGGVTAFTAL